MSRHRAVAMAPGYGWIDDSKGRRPLAPSPRHRDLDGRLVRVVHAFRRHSRKANGHQGKAAHAFVPRPRVIQATGDRDGVRHQEIGMASHRSSSRTRRDSADGAEAQLISSLMVLLICRHLDAVIAVCGNPRCHSDFHPEIAMSPQAPPVTRCYVCGQLGCHSSRHREYARPPTPNTPSQQESRPAMGTMSPPLNYQRGPQQGDRAPQY